MFFPISYLVASGSSSFVILNGNETATPIITAQGEPRDVITNNEPLTSFDVQRRNSGESFGTGTHSSEMEEDVSSEEVEGDIANLLEKILALMHRVRKNNDHVHKERNGHYYQSPSTLRNRRKSRAVGKGHLYNRDRTGRIFISKRRQ